MSYELEPMYSSQKSFYGNAHVISKDELLILRSYETDVACYDNYSDRIEIYGWYSDTTTRHIVEFVSQMKGRKMTKKEIERMANEKPL